MSGNLDDGFKSAEDSLNAITAQNNQLQQQISSGQLIMNPDAATNAAKAYDNAARTIERLVAAGDQLGHVTGLGSYTSGQQLATKFTHKAANGTSGAVDLLKQLSQELKRKADLFRQACQDYQTRDEQIAHDLGRVSP
jgi:uncharacterized protein YukE